MNLKLSSSFITNLKKPICVACSHFIEYTNNYPYDELPSDKLGKCSKFGTIHLVTGEVEYNFALSCRKDKNKCGEEGLYFTKKNK